MQPPLSIPDGAERQLSSMTRRLFFHRDSAVVMVATISRDTNEVRDLYEALSRAQHIHASTSMSSPYDVFGHSTLGR